MSAGRVPLPRAALFDLDGTLVDSLDDIAYALNRTRREAGLDESPRETVRRWIGGGAPKLVARSLGTEDDRDPRVAPLLARFLEIYGTESGPRSPLLPGARDLLDALARRGVVLACTTNKPLAATRTVLAAHGIDVVFGDAVVTPDCSGARKPERAFFERALRLAGGVAPHDALVVGDGVPDVRGGREIGAPTVAILGGYGDREALVAAGPTWTVETIAELAARIAW